MTQSADIKSQQGCTYFQGMRPWTYLLSPMVGQVTWLQALPLPLGLMVKWFCVKHTKSFKCKRTQVTLSLV